MSLETTVYRDTQDNLELLKKLHIKPVISWPVVFILSLCLPVAIYLIIAVTSGWINPVLAAMPGALIGYFLFTPIHEAVHRSASNKEWVNTLIAMLTINVLLPYVSPKLLRWGHMQHHRFTNEVGKDPDRLLTNHWFGPVLLWPFFELFYLPQYLKTTEKRPKNERLHILLQLPLGFAALAVLFAFCGWNLFVFWFIASRLGLWLIVFVFVYLPHHPHEVLQRDDIYGASSMREGHEWLLTILMVGQNRHLVHHLYPTIPFYRMKDAWEARLTYHESQRPMRVKAFALQPERDTVDVDKDGSVPAS